MNPHDRNETETIERSTQHGKHTTHKQDMMHNKHDAWQSYMKLLMERDYAKKEQHIKASLNEAGNNI